MTHANLWHGDVRLCITAQTLIPKNATEAFHFLTVYFTYRKCRLVSSCNLLYILSDLLQQSPFIEPNSRSDSQKIPSVIWNHKIYYSAHKIPLPTLITNKI